MKLQYMHENKMYVAFTIAKHLMNTLEEAEAKKTEFPFYATITNKNEIYEFI